MGSRGSHHHPMRDSQARSSSHHHCRPRCWVQTQAPRGNARRRLAVGVRPGGRRAGRLCPRTRRSARGERQEWAHRRVLSGAGAAVGIGSGDTLAPDDEGGHPRMVTRAVVGCTPLGAIAACGRGWGPSAQQHAYLALLLLWPPRLLLLLLPLLCGGWPVPLAMMCP